MSVYRVAIFPFALPMHPAGRMRDDFQGIYSRGLCRALAEGLLRTQVCEVGVYLPIVDIGGVRSWAVSGKEWSVNEALRKSSFRVDAEFLTVGTMSIAERMALHLVLISYYQGKSLLDRCFEYARAQFLECLTEMVATMASALTGRRLSDEESQRLGCWGTDSAEAYLAYLEAWSAAAAFRFGIDVPNPRGVLECARIATRIDPNFPQALRLEQQLSCVNPERYGNEVIRDMQEGYAEFVFPIHFPTEGTTS